MVRARGCEPRDMGSIPVHHPNQYCTARVRIWRGGPPVQRMRRVRFPPRAPCPSSVSGLRVRLKSGRSRFDSGGGHFARIAQWQSAAATRRRREFDSFFAHEQFMGVPSGRITALQAEISGFDSRRLHCPVDAHEPAISNRLRVWGATRVADAPFRGREVANGKRVIPRGRFAWNDAGSSPARAMPS